MPVHWDGTSAPQAWGKSAWVACGDVARPDPAAALSRHSIAARWMCPEHADVVGSHRDATATGGADRVLGEQLAPASRRTEDVELEAFADRQRSPSRWRTVATRHSTTSARAAWCAEIPSPRYRRPFGGCARRQADEWFVGRR